MGPGTASEAQQPGHVSRMVEPSSQVSKSSPETRQQRPCSPRKPSRASPKLAFVVCGMAGIVGERGREGQKDVFH